MLVIRREQMTALGLSLRQRFEGEMTVHLREFFPDRCRAMSRDDLLEFIQRSIDKALRYGIERERDVCQFLDVAMALGEDFDQRQEYLWIQDILTDTSADGLMKTERLVNAALRTVEKRIPDE